MPVNTAPSEQTLLPHGRGFSSQARESVASAAQTSSSFYFPTQIVWRSSTYISSSLERSWPCPRHSTTSSKMFSDWSPGSSTSEKIPWCAAFMLSDHPTTSSILLLHCRFSSVQVRVTQGLGPREHLRREPRPSGSRHPPVRGPHLRARRERPEPQPRGWTLSPCFHSSCVSVGKEGLFPNSVPHREATWGRGFDVPREGRGRSGSACAVHEGWHPEPQGSGPRDPKGRRDGIDRETLAETDSSVPILQRTCHGGRLWLCRKGRVQGVSNSVDQRILSPRIPIALGSSTEENRGVFWSMLDAYMYVCVCVLIYVYMGVHVHTSVCLHVYTCVCVGVGAVACCCHLLHSFELRADAKTPEQSENPWLRQSFWINAFILYSLDFF